MLVQNNAFAKNQDYNTAISLQENGVKSQLREVLDKKKVEYVQALLKELFQ